MGWKGYLRIVARLAEMLFIDIRVYYSPTNPRQTILEPFAPRDKMFIALGVGIGLVLLPVGLYACRKRH
jgi:hypothetical protein